MKARHHTRALRAAFLLVGLSILLLALPVCAATAPPTRRAAAGTRWTTTTPLKAVDFVSGSCGWAAGNGGLILRTTTGGRTWTTQRRYRSARGDIIDLSFVNRSRGWASGSSGLLLRTTNGGAAWRVQSPSVGGDNLTSVKAVSSSVVWTCGGFASAIFDDAHPPTGTVWRSGSGGAAWTHADFTGFAPVALDATGGLTCWAVGPLRHQTDPTTGYNTFGWTVTTDGGATWSPPAEIFNAPVVVGTPWGIDVRGATIAVVGADDGTGTAVAMVSADGGASWNAITWPLGSSSIFTDVKVVSSTTVYAVGVSRIVWKTTDGGVTWGPHQLPANVAIEDLDFVSGSTGYVVGRYGAGTETGRVYKTTSGATRWTRVR